MRGRGNQGVGQGRAGEETWIVGFRLLVMVGHNLPTWTSFVLQGVDLF